MRRAPRRDVLLPLVAALTLGLAPFVPQPHVWEKLTWLATGHAFGWLDVIDLLMHGAPWAWLATALLLRLRRAP